MKAKSSKIQQIMKINRSSSRLIDADTSRPFFVKRAEFLPHKKHQKWDGDPVENNIPNSLENQKNNPHGIVSDIETPEGSAFYKGVDESNEGIFEPNNPGNVELDLQVKYTELKDDTTTNVKMDPVESGISLGGFTQPGGKVVSPFGAESFEPAFKNISYNFLNSKCFIKGSLEIICPWGTNAGGKTDIPSATSPVVTKTNYAQISKDLKPDTASPHKSPRTKYYSQNLVERHEKFHGTDDLKWAKTSGVSMVKTFIQKGNVSSKNAAKEVPVLIEGSRQKLISENAKWYKGGGTSHGSYAGEIRAYADGKPHYSKLAKEVTNHGKTL